MPEEVKEEVLEEDHKEEKKRKVFLLKQELPLYLMLMNKQQSFPQWCELACWFGVVEY